VRFAVMISEDHLPRERFLYSITYIRMQRNKELVKPIFRTLFVSETVTSSRF